MADPAGLNGSAGGRAALAAAGLAAGLVVAQGGPG